jgi:hypothetical protein
VESYFSELRKKMFFEGIVLLEKLWNECVSVNGSHVEK